MASDVNEARCRPVLPDPKGAFPAMNDPGRHDVEFHQLEHVLLPNRAVHAEGVPAVYSRQFAFEWTLCRQGDGAERLYAVQQLEALTRAAFFGILAHRSFPLRELGDFGALIANERRGKNFLVLYYYDGLPVAVADDRTTLFPTPLCTPDLIARIALEVEQQIAEYDTLPYWGGTDKIEARAAARFLRWASRAALTRQGVQDTAAAVLETLARKWARGRELPKPIELLPGQADPEIAQVPGSLIPVFIGHIQVCPSCQRNILEITPTSTQTVTPESPYVVCACGHRFDWRSFFPQGVHLVTHPVPARFLIWRLDPKSLPRFVTVTYDDTQSQAVYRFGKFPVIVKGRILAPSDILVPRVVGLSSPDGGDVKYPSHPVRREFLGVVRASKLDRADHASVHYQIALEGLTKTQELSITISTLRDRAAQHQVGLYLWPRFTTPTWKLNYALFTCQPSLAVVEFAPVMRLLSADGKAEAELSDPSPVKPARKLLFTPHYFGLSWLEPSGRTELGFFTVPPEARVEIKDLSGNRKLAFDFGTSNTLVAVEAGSGGEMFQFAPLAFDALTGAAPNPDPEAPGIRSMEASHRWLPLTRFEPKPEIVPSEVVFLDANPRPEDLNSPLERFTVKNTSIRYFPGPAISDEAQREAMVAVAAQRHFVSNFKWDLVGPLAGWDRERVTSEFIRMVLDLVVGSCVFQSHTGTLNFVVTYPLAFDESRRAAYERNWGELATKLREETGVSVSLTPFLDESRAGALGAGIAGSDLHVVVDIGGGTTDIAVFLERNRFQFLDSLRYGGDDLLRTLANNDILPAQAKRSLDSLRQFLERRFPGYAAQKETIEEAAIFALTREWMRAGDVARWFAGMDGARRLQQAKRIVNFFYAGVFEYVAALIQRANGLDGAPRNVIVHALGNGWLLRQAVAARSAIYESAEAEIEALAQPQGYRIHVLPPQEDKGGALPNPKRATAFGALRAHDQAAINAIQYVHRPFARTTVTTIAGLDFNVGLRDGARTGAQEVRADDRVPLRIGQPVASVVFELDDLNQRFRGYQSFLNLEIADIQLLQDLVLRKIDASGREPILFESPLKLFLESIYLPKLGNLAREGEE